MSLAPIGSGRQANNQLYRILAQVMGMQMSEVVGMEAVVENNIQDHQEDDHQATWHDWSSSVNSFPCREPPVSTGKASVALRIGGS
jgi:hypothetical protein